MSIKKFQILRKKIPCCCIFSTFEQSYFLFSAIIEKNLETSTTIVIVLGFKVAFIKSKVYFTGTDFPIRFRVFFSVH